MLNSPAIRSFFGSLQRRNGKPKNRATHRVLARNNFAVVVPDRLPGPPNSFRCLRQGYIQQGHFFFGQEQGGGLSDVRLQLRQGWLTIVGHWRADRDAAQSQQRSLLRSRERAGMPTGIAKIQTKINSGQDKVDVAPPVSAERDTIGRCAINSISLVALQPNPFVA